MAKATLAEAVQELWYWQYGNEPTNFTTLLYKLIAKADMGNKARLAAAFPMEFEAFQEWTEALDAIEFFKSYGIIVTEKPKR